MNRTIRIISLALLLGLCLSSCQNKTISKIESFLSDSSDDLIDSLTDVEQENETEEQTEEETLPSLNSADALILSKKHETDYTVVIDDALGASAEKIIKNFCTRFSNKTGAEFTISDDNAPATDKEILIYTMDGRSEYATVYNKITAPQKNGYRIEVVGDRIVVACGNEDYLTWALALLDEAIRPCENGAFGLEKDYVGKLDIPIPATNPVSSTRMISSGEGNITLVIDHAYKELYTEFLKALSKDGFSKYSENRIGYACFATYYKDSQFGKQAVYAMYYPDDSCYKITYGPLYDLPTVKASTNQELVTPSFSQIRRVEGSGEGQAPGMCCVVQCSDGKYIVFDGGGNNAEDKQTLYSYLVQNNPREGCPTIAAWVITHAHGDHMRLANSFLNDYSGKINLEMVVHNFPDWNSISIRNESVESMLGLASQFESVVEKNFPNAKKWIAHTGEVMQFAGCSMTVMYTPEDYATSMGLDFDDRVYFPWGNHTNTSYRLDINGTTVMMLGDSESTLNEWMARTYKEDLKSDILQLAHHGFNGGHIALYQKIDPDICIWPVEGARMQSSMTQYDFNRYLLTQTKEGNDRVHHSMDDTVIYECTASGPIRRKDKVN